MKLRNLRPAFTLIELLIVIGIIALLVAMLMPALARARRQAETVECQSNLKQIGYALQMYSQRSDGWVFPERLGGTSPHSERWPVHVFTPPVWNPPILLCPSDLEPAEEHSYILNDWITMRYIRTHTTDLAGLSSSEFIVMGEKKSHVPDYYSMAGPTDHGGETGSLMEYYRHGIHVGSNYLFLDGHVQPLLQQDAERGLNPWRYRRPSGQ